MSDAPSVTEEVRCTFCDKPSSELGQLIAAPERRAFICNECLGLSRGVIVETLDPIASAKLHIAAFAALRGWGAPGPDGKWASWNGHELRLEARRLVVWALSTAPVAKLPEPTPEPKETPE